MEDWERAKRYLEERFQRDSVIVGTPESLAEVAGFERRDMEKALAALVDENKIQPFQDDEGTLEYQWKASY